MKVFSENFEHAIHRLTVLESEQNCALNREKKSSLESGENFPFKLRRVLVKKAVEVVRKVLEF